MKNAYKKTLIVLGSVIFMLPTFVTAGPTFGFDRITSNSVNTAGVGESQLFVEVIDAGSGKVTFLFTNTGPEASSITDIYFDDDADTLLNIDNIDNSDPGVQFTAGAAPGDLPSGNTLLNPFEATAGLTADSDAPVSSNGINPGESLPITLSLSNSSSYAGLLNAIDGNTLRIGLHVQAFADGASESYVNTTVVPAPSAILLGSIGLGFIRLLRDRKEAAVV